MFQLSGYLMSRSYGKNHLRLLAWVPGQQTGTTVLETGCVTIGQLCGEPQEPLLNQGALFGTIEPWASS